MSGFSVSIPTSSDLQKKLYNKAIPLGEGVPPFPDPPCSGVQTWKEEVQVCMYASGAALLLLSAFGWPAGDSDFLPYPKWGRN